MLSVDVCKMWSPGRLGAQYLCNVILYKHFFLRYNSKSMAFNIATSGGGNLYRSAN